MSSNAPINQLNIRNRFIGLQIEISVSVFFSRLFHNNMKVDDIIILVIKYLLFQF